MQKKSTKKALLMSLLSLVVCISMLVGSTFAWFTDSVTSANNIIQSGNLDVELYYMNDVTADWAKVNKDTNVFKDGALWEPGHTEVVKLKVVNEGSLALKYQLGVNVASEVESVNVNNKPFKLSDYIYFGIVEGDQTYTREQAVAAVSGTATKLNAPYSKSDSLLAKNDTDSDEETVTMVVYMPTTVGNDANYKKDAAVPTINLGINLFATQDTVEADSFGTDYDKAAPWTGAANTDWYFEDPDATEFTIESAEELAGLAALVNGTATAPTSTFALRSSATVQDSFAGKTVKLAADLDLKDIPWTPIGRIGDNGNSTDFTYSFKGTFDGQNHTVSNLYVDNSGWAGLFGLAHSATINNVKLSGVTIMSNRMAGSVVGQLYGSVDNCHVEKANIIVVPNAVEGGFDNGDKVGGIVGWLGDNGNNRTLTNCSATEIEVSAYRDVGGIAGYVASSTTVSGNKVKKVQVIADQTTNYYGDKDVNAGLIYGRTGGAITDENNDTDEAESNVTKTYNKNGLTLREHNGQLAFHNLPAEYDETTVNVPEGVTSIGGYAFDKNDNIKKIVLPSSVTTLNDRAFRDTSASEVILNEGLTNISYQAFRNALNVTSVEIPSTVTTISKEAFQNSGVTTLDIPASVTTIEYGGLRDMKKLVSVTIHGNVDIPVYAFRACENLRIVILKGDNVTFGGGSRGMIFTNKENGDGSAITVYVANETVKERLLAADTAAKDYGGYKIKILGAVNEYDSVADIDEALADGEYVSVTNDLSFNASTTTANSGYGATGVKVAGGVLDGNGNTINVTGANGTWDCAVNTTGGTIQNATISGAMRGIFMGGAVADVYINNVVFKDVVYTFNSDGGNKDFGVYLTNCVMNGWTSFSKVHKEVIFTSCSFGEGSGYAYCRPYNDASFVGCNFEKDYVIDARQADKITFIGCYYDGTLITAENAASLGLFSGNNYVIK